MQYIGFIIIFVLGLYLAGVSIVVMLMSKGFSGKVDWWHVVPCILGSVGLLYWACVSGPFSITVTG
jgi:hypothetical protein